MVRYGPQFGPDITFLGVDRCDWSDPSTYADADVVILGAPFDGGASHRSGTRFGPQFIRQTCYLAHDGSRPSLAMRVDALRDLRVLDAGDVEMFSGDAERSVRDLQEAVHAVASNGAVPLILGGDHTIAWPDAAGVAQHHGQGRVSMIHFDAHADTTSFLANRVVLEALSGIARRKRDQCEGTTWDPGLPLLAGRRTTTTSTLQLSNGALR